MVQSIDRTDFLAAVRRSRALHRPWCAPPATIAAFDEWLVRSSTPRFCNFLLRLAATDELVGVVNASEIVRGSFQSAYLGYYAFEPFAGRGLMSVGLSMVIDQLLGRNGLHRLEANIQPSNESSRRLVQRLGFRLEGYSPRYLKIAGRWRDHERWALLAEEWRGRRS
ncbi:MAG: GNAT family N-acetyltransferase [Phycisphaerales bacterium]|nr:GNAT family N-acetyltransferase [Phycisphaerales bacterium]